MKTTTVRLDDDLLLLVQKLGSLTERGTADVIRDALRAYIGSSVVDNDEFRAFAQDVASQRLAARLAASRSEIEETLGDLLPADAEGSASR
ncbi:MAG TPA: ribbon-helix-helix protein, CopG family [Conexibacter sp.]